MQFPAAATSFIPMNYCLCFLLLASLGSCSQADPQQQLHTQADPFLGHWQCDSIATFIPNGAGSTQGRYRVEYVDVTLDVTPRQYQFVTGIAFSDTAAYAYTRHGQELTATFVSLNRKPLPGYTGRTVPTQIITLTPTVLRTEERLSMTPSQPLRVRHFYHR